MKSPQQKWAERNREKCNEDQRRRYRDDPEVAQRSRDATRRWRERNKERRAEYARKYLLDRKYGLTTEDWDRMWAAQKGRCGICGCKMKRGVTSRVPGAAVVDHCHKNGEVRQLLCTNCNKTLGLIENHALGADEFMDRVRSYLVDHQG